MSKEVYGKDHILMFRLYADRTKSDAAKLALQTTHSWKYEAKSDSTETKDGNINSPATTTASLDIEAVASLDDTNKMLFDAAKNQKLLEVWDINLADPQGEDGSKQFSATYGQGYLQSWEVPSEVGKLTTIKTTMNINQLPQEGVATLTEAQVEEIQYAFADTIKVAEDADDPKADTPVAVTGVTVAPATASVEVGKTVKLAASVAPADATDKTGAWSSVDTATATVAEDGTVTGVAAGSTKVQFTTTDGQKAGSADITVTAPEEG